MNNIIRPFDYQPSTRVVYGPGCLERLGELARALGGQRLLVVTDPGLIEAGILAKAVEYLNAAGLDCMVFSDLSQNPTTRQVEAGAAFAQAQGDIDLIVGLGGGSAMDGAKGINFLLTNGGRIQDYQGMGHAAKPLLPSLGIPTTAGTGSEAQSYALISHADTHKKIACGDPQARFHTVILDPELLQSVPPQVRAITGLDALAHAIESYVCTRRNPVSQLFAQRAFQLLNGAFDPVLDNAADLTSQGAMLLGAHWAGAAIENAMLGAAHACANPLTAQYNITHGTAVALMLPHVIRFNAQVAADCYAELAAAAQFPICTPNALAAAYEKQRDHAQLPELLSDCDVAQVDLPVLAAAAAQEWTATFNPRPLDAEACLTLYMNAY
jgi:alcohol dehydrogenase